MATYYYCRLAHKMNANMNAKTYRIDNKTMARWVIKKPNSFVR